METRLRSTPGLRFFEDFEPSSEWAQDESSETLLIKLPGFKKEQIKVQVDNYRNLRIGGERPLDGNRWSRFHKDFRIPENINISEIRAKFENEALYLIHPKPVTRAQEPPATPLKPGGVQHGTTPKVRTGASAEPGGTAGKEADGKRSEPAEAKKEARATQEREKERVAQKSVDAGKEEPLEVAEKAAAAGEVAGVQKSVHAGKKDPPAAEKEKAAAVGEAAGDQKSVHARKKEQPAAEKEKDAGGQKSVDAGKKEPPAAEKEKDAGIQKSVDEGKNEPTAAEKEKDAGGERGGESVGAGKKEPPAEKVGSGGVSGSAGTGGGPGTVREGVDRLALGQRKSRQLLVNVAAAIMVLLGLGMYLTYKLRKAN